MLHASRLTSRKITRRLQLIRPLIYRRQQPLPDFCFLELPGPEKTPYVQPEVDDSDWTVIPANSYWAGRLTNFVLRTQFALPEGWTTDAPVMLYLPLGEPGDFSHPEALMYIDGEPYAACDRHHQEVRLSERWLDGATHTLALHGWTGLHAAPHPRLPHARLFMQQCALVQVDQPTRDFVARARVALGVAELLDEDDPALGRLLNALDAAFMCLDLREPFGDHFYASVPYAAQTLEEGIRAAGAPLDVDVIGAGHAHIDVAWLWPLAQTRQKAARTFSTVLRLMEDFPEYHFTQSQPQLYRYVEEDQPALFEQIRERVAEGRWEVIGGSWVEPDCNASGAEALVRQFLLGRRYFRERFGDVETPVFWLPDTFGYPWALPQLIARAGIRYFITHKISWNQFNRLPYQTFWWQGLDGTRVLTHFITTPEFPPSVDLPYSTTYNSQMRPVELIGTWRNYLQKEQNSQLLTVYGYGDGGGGPTREMLEDARALAEHPGAPRLRLGTVRDFMRHVEASSAALPVWNGELYLEYHRGTYTSQARTKRNNRKAEIALHNAEFLAAWAALTAGYRYPHDVLNRAWELVCLNQFHDILPGSSIGEVYVDSQRDYEAIFALAEQVRSEALAALARRLPAGADVLVINPTPFGGRRLAFVPEASGVSFTLETSGQPLVSQAVDGGVLVDVPHVDAYGAITLSQAAEAAASPEDAVTAWQQGDLIVLENAVLRVEIDSNGDVVRVFDREAEREVLAPGQRGNILQAFEDRPLNFDAWDIDIFFEDKQWEAEPAYHIAVIETGPLRAAVEVRRRLDQSDIHQRIYLYRNSRRIDFDTWVDWRERHVLLKAAFPVDILSPTATYDIQWGNIERPTHRNTSWDWARFEVCAHKWADLSEGDYGVSLLNDCKYGYDVHDNVLRLTLLKSATEPDPNADLGEHRFTYSLLPHRGDWRNGTVAEGYDLNNPLAGIRVTGSGNGAQPLDLSALVSVDRPNAIIETVKLAEDGNGVIVRLYENERTRGPVRLSTSFTLAEVWECNLLEENEQALAIEDGGTALILNLTPYAIRTLRLVPR